MRINSSPATILLVVAVVLFVLAAIGVDIDNVSLVALGLAAFAASFLFGKDGINLGR